MNTLINLPSPRKGCKMDKEEVKYLVRLNDSQIDKDDLGYMLHQTICNKIFCGVLVNIFNSSLYFEIGEDKKLVIIPHRWVEWMAPARENFKEGDINGKSNCN